MRAEPQAGQRRGGRRRGAAVVAAQGHARGVEDQRSLALGADLDVAAVPAEDDAGRAATVEDQDRPLARVAVEGLECRGELAGTGASGCRWRAPRAGPRRRHVAAARPPARAGVKRSMLPSSTRPTVTTSGVALDRTTGAEASRPSSMAMSRAWKRGVRSDL